MGREIMTTATRRKPTGRRKPAEGAQARPCAFCNGAGRDPYEILSRLAKCPVCKGHKTVDVKTPAVPCASCRGTGRQRHTRLTCSACKGTGFVTLEAGPTTQCSQCSGTGRAVESDLACSLCKGAGLIVKKPGGPRRATRE